MSRGRRTYSVVLHLDRAGNILSAGMTMFGPGQDVIGLRAVTPEPFDDPNDVVKAFLDDVPTQAALFDQGPLETRGW